MGFRNPAYQFNASCRFRIVDAAIVTATVQKYGCTPARTGVGVYTVTLEQEVAANEVTCTAGVELVTAAFWTYVQDSATQFTIRTWDAAGAALEIVGLSVELKGCTTGAPGAD